MGPESEATGHRDTKTISALAVKLDRSAYKSEAEHRTVFVDGTR
uniref:Uncharacterized protein n=2 Tax=Ralstonia TaxID=48736 RepID=A0A0S4UBN0_RALSL|nr:conserved protein of unknown function [Ralstonia solanacearum]